ncbi:MAG: acyl-CoA dehydrogenase [Alphaproteobacteria bacterium]|jgi:acyl-CoA dehydrogenase|nr:acyl-CoA dehydrogenase [Alphaproteobacteria bacterium]
MIRDQKRLDRALENIRDVVRSSWIPREPEVDRLAHLPDDIVAEMRQRGLFAYGVPEEYGGEGMTCEELAHINMEISQCSLSFRTRVSNNIGIGVVPFLQGGTEAQKRFYLPKIATGEIVMAFAVSELDIGGSQATKMRTVARRDGDGWILNGSKCYVSLAPVANRILMYARTDLSGKGLRGITCFVLEPGTAGLEIGKPYRKMGQHGMAMSEVHVRDCRVGPETMLGSEPGFGFETLMRGFLFQRINLSGLSIGPALRMVEEALRFAGAARPGREPFASHQLIQAMLAESQVDIEAARALLLQTARRYDEGKDVTMQASVTKYFSTEMVCRVADRIVQIFGARGYIADYSPIEMLYRDVRGGRMAEGTSQIHLLTIAREMLKGAA